jgi:hypothetical protein
MIAMPAVAMDTGCPLCGESLLSVQGGGFVTSSDTSILPLLRHGAPGEGFLVCDGCAYLAHLPADVTLN